MSSPFAFTCPTCSRPAGTHCVGSNGTPMGNRAHPTRRALSLTPAEREVLAVADESFVEPIRPMAPADAVDYLRAEAAYLNSGGWVPERAAALDAYADRIEAA